MLKPCSSAITANFRSLCQILTGHVLSISLHLGSDYMSSTFVVLRPLRLLLLLALLGQCQEQVEFFYSTELDTCVYGNYSIPASNNTENGGLCAITRGYNRVYACPAPNP